MYGNTKPQGLHGFSSEYSLKQSREMVSVIVLFSSHGLKRVCADANDGRVEQAAVKNTDIGNDCHSLFEKKLRELFCPGSTPSESAQEYKITSIYKGSFNGVALTLPSSRLPELLKIECVQAVYPNEAVRLDPPDMLARPPMR